MIELLPRQWILILASLWAAPGWASDCLARSGGHEPIYDPPAVADFGAQLLEFFGGRWK